MEHGQVIERDTLYAAPESPETSDETRWVMGNADLPIANHRTELVEALATKKVVIVEAPTGSGKSTQLGMYAKEMRRENGNSMFDRIYVTQPRIVAARSVAQRVQQEISQAQQNFVSGYSTSKESSDIPQHQQDITFFTDGKLLAQLLHEPPNAKNRSRLILLDEVHERNLNIEQLLAVMRKMTSVDSKWYDKNLTVGIMSATLNTAMLESYFAHCDPAVVRVDVPTHKITDKYVDSSVARVAFSAAMRTRGTVLTFLPSKKEIAKAATEIEALAAQHTKDVLVVPLHAQMHETEQHVAIQEHAGPRIVLATNVAETSVTIPDVKVVVDSLAELSEQHSYDMVPTGHKSLVYQPISKASARQRRGRGGRTCESEYIQLPAPYPHELPKHSVPAIQRAPLDGLLLRLRATGRTIEEFDYLSQPPKASVMAAKRKLQLLGALDGQGNITERGKFMSGLPLDPELATMVACAYENGYSDQVMSHVLDVVSVMERGGVCSRSGTAWRRLLALDQNGEIKEKDSDLLAQLEVYVAYKALGERASQRDYDVNTYNVELVAKTRKKLYDLLQLPLDEATLVSTEHRNEVLTCIHAGQIAQLFVASDEGLQLVTNREFLFEPARASVAVIGKLATGNLFTLRMPTTEYTNVQDITAVRSLHILETAAKHLVEEKEVEGSIGFNSKTQTVTIKIQKRLGNIILGTYERPVVDEGDYTTQTANDLYTETVWQQSPFRHVKRESLTLQTIDHAIAAPQRVVYGVHPVTGEELFAYVGGNGKLLRCSEDEARVSLEAYKARLVKQPERLERIALKEQLASLKTQVIAKAKELEKTNKKPDNDRARQLRSMIKGPNTTEQLRILQEALEHEQYNKK